MIDVHKLRSKKNNIIASVGVAVVLLALAYMAWNAWKPTRTLAWSDRVQAYAFAHDFYAANADRPGTTSDLTAFIDECHTKKCVVLPYERGEEERLIGTARIFADKILRDGIHIETPPGPQKRGLFGFLPF